MFSSEFCEIFQDIFFEEHLQKLALTLQKCLDNSSLGNVLFTLEFPHWFLYGKLPDDSHSYMYSLIYVSLSFKILRSLE